MLYGLAKISNVFKDYDNNTLFTLNCTTHSSKNRNRQYEKGNFTEIGFCFGKMNETEPNQKRLSSSAFHMGGT